MSFPTGRAKVHNFLHCKLGRLPRSKTRALWGRPNIFWFLFAHVNKNCGKVGIFGQGLGLLLVTFVLFRQARQFPCNDKYILHRLCLEEQDLQGLSRCIHHAGANQTPQKCPGGRMFTAARENGRKGKSIIQGIVSCIVQ